MIVSKEADGSIQNEMEGFQKEINDLAVKYGVGCIYSAFKKTDTEFDEEGETNENLLSSGGILLLSKNREDAGDAILKCFGTAIDCVFDYAKKNNYNIAIFCAKLVEVVSEMSLNIFNKNLEKERILREKYGFLGEMFARFGIIPPDLD